MGLLWNRSTNQAQRRGSLSVSRRRKEGLILKAILAGVWVWVWLVGLGVCRFLAATSLEPMVRRVGSLDELVQG